MQVVTSKIQNHAKKILAYEVHKSNICTLTNYD